MISQVYLIIGGLVALIGSLLTAYFVFRNDGKTIQQKEDLNETIRNAQMANDVENNVASMSDAAVARMLRDKYGPK